jgi:valyl-tRNA synthetase
MTELEKTYDPKAVEHTIYELWQQSGYFNPDKLPGERTDAYTIIMPPPNVTGTLHIGHAMFATIQDILIRYRRMQGKKTLWLPGTDHAAIATQAKVEADLYKKSGKTRFDYPREEFLKLVETFAAQSHDTIITQLKRLGASSDWSREAYTLDEPRTLAVRTAFKRMYEDGLIYRGRRIVNWDPKLKTTVSDDEIEWKEEAVPLYYLRYGPFTIATARPETKFGDKYVVMHPDDKRYKQYKHGDKIEVEWINGRVTATIIKDPVIDMTFGSGAMTITPWHDTVDFEIAQRHKLDAEQIIDERGCLLPIAGEFVGQHIKKARLAIVDKLRDKGLIEKVEEKYVHRIATNSRGGGIIEPQIKLQWFVDVNKKFRAKGAKLNGVKKGQEVSLKDLMKKTVESGQIKIIPERFAKIYFHWIDNLRDWCISRQIWYGHRIPVWYKGDQTYCGVTAPEGEGWEQDFDTDRKSVV